MPTKELTTRRSYKLRIFPEHDAASLEIIRTSVATSLAVRRALHYLMCARAALTPDMILTGEEEPSFVRHCRRITVSCWFTAEVPTADNADWRTLPQDMEKSVPKAWRDDVADILHARLRDDAVWIDRRAAWRDLQKEVPDAGGLVTDLLARFLSGDNLWGQASDGIERDLDCIMIGSSFISDRLGQGEKGDFSQFARAYDQAADWCRAQSQLKPFASLDDLEASFASALGKNTISEAHACIQRGPVSGFGPLVTWRSTEHLPDADELTKAAKKFEEQAQGCRDKVSQKGKAAWSDHFGNDILCVLNESYDPDNGSNERNFLKVVLDHAGRQLCQQHARLRHSLALRDKSREEAAAINDIPNDHLALCRGLEAALGLEMGLENYSITKRSLVAHDAILAAWELTTNQSERLETLYAWREQAIADGEPTGDVRLFALLADDAYLPLWRDSKGRVRKMAYLKMYQRARAAEVDMRRYRHPVVAFPHPYQSPIWNDYGTSRPTIQFSLQEDQRKAKVQKRLDRERAIVAKPIKNEKQRLKRDEAQQKVTDLFRLVGELSDVQGVRIATIGAGKPSVFARWANKRLMANFGIGEPAIASDVTVGRKDRPSLACAHAEHIEGFLSDSIRKPWAGKLLTGRKQLQAFRVALENCGVDPFAPWSWDASIEHLASRVGWHVSVSLELPIVGPWANLANDTKTVDLNPDASRWPFAASNKIRAGRSRLGLCRIPGLRVTGAVFGARNPLAVAVVETISDEALREICALNKVPYPKAHELVVRVRHKRKKSLVTYRRIADTKLPDGSPHPAPWARIDRQSQIALPGDPQSSSPERNLIGAECDLIQTVLSDLGLGTVPLSGKVSYVQRRVIDHLRSHLDRLNRLALIVYYLGQTDEQERRKGWSLLVAAVHDAHDPQHASLAALCEELLKTPIPAPEPDRRSMKRSAYKLAMQEFRSSLNELDAMTTPRPRAQLGKAIKEWWTHNLGEPASDDHHPTGWFKILRQVRDWICPASAHRGTVLGTMQRRVGGLTLGRIGTLQALYRLLSSWNDRVLPDEGPSILGQRKVRGFASYVLEAMQRVRRERERYLASAVTQSAVPYAMNGVIHIGDDRISVKEPHRWAPCHALVTRETSSVPSTLNTRQLNASLMRMSLAGVDDLVSEQCELHGIHRRSIHSSYTERVNALTLRPGMRAVAVRSSDDLRAFRKQLQRLKSLREAQGGVLDEQSLSPFEHLLWMTSLTIEEAGPLREPLYIPHKFGPVLVSLNANGKINCVDADTNGALATALELLTDPDSECRWTRAAFTKKRGGSTVWTKTVQGSMWLENQNPPESIQSKSAIVNAWRIPYSNQPFEETAVFWEHVEAALMKYFLNSVLNVRGAVLS